MSSALLPPPRLTTLASGLRVVSQELPWADSVALGVWASVGTRHEPAHLNGISHLIEHMAFKGTKRRSAARIAEEIEDVGGILNAYTGRETTAFHARVLKEDLGLGLDILADIVQHSVFDPQELAREQSVVVQEIWQSIDTPDDIVFDHFQAAAYPAQAMGRPVLGSEATVRAMTRDDLVGYLATTYAPERLVIAAAGPLDHDDLLARVGALFTDLPGRPGASAPEPARYQGGEHREGRDVEQVQLVLGFPGVAYDDPDYYALSVLATLLGGGMSSRLFQEIREVRGLAYAVHAYPSSWTDGGLMTLYAGTSPEEAGQVLDLMISETARLPGTISGPELARAKAQMKAGLLMGQEGPAGRCEQIARQVAIFGRPIPLAESVERIEAVSAADLDRLTRRLLAATPTLAALGPLGTVPAHADLMARLAA
ncbi:M16 family metallopeptidase [Roseospirillum parvum]|uniref:Predicted Zn-dependent peptidase n=1 Tax=Roseospirillum parvum TaxID=83401 RepID=A0A1G7UVS8_9PROT|nr:pitrilysin family protein [Roseospirillum parvum]SDG50830.1 Predicted Zn-dependent peptidase [Roseospirillum parvum]